MAFYKFDEDDVVINTIETNPEYEFIIYNGDIFLNNKTYQTGTLSGVQINGVKTGYVSLYELNVDRNRRSKIYPFVTKNGTTSAFKTVSTSNFNSNFLYGDIIKGDYPMSASIKRYYVTEHPYREVRALRNTITEYARFGPHYSYENVENTPTNLISIPSIIYGSEIKKGTVVLKYNVTGTTIAEARDTRRNGELIQVGPPGSPGSGSTVGYVLYNEGFLVLTSSDSLEGSKQRDYINDATNLQYSSWLFYGFSARDGIEDKGAGAHRLHDVSFSLYFKGTTRTQNMMILATAPREELNYSNNPTFIDKSTSKVYNANTGSNIFVESASKIKNTISSSYPDATGSFVRQTFISKICLYDDEKNLIGVATVSTPVRKTEKDDVTFKLKLDI